MSAADSFGRIRVLHVITDLRVGGAELQLARLIEGVSTDQRSSVLVGVVSLRAGGAVADRIEDAGVRVWRLGASGPLSFVRAVRSLRAVLRNERPDVAVAWLYHAMVATRIAAWGLPGVQQAWNVRGTVPRRADRPQTRLALRLAAAMSGSAARVVYNSDTARLEHASIGFPTRGSLVIPNGYETAVRAEPAGASGRAPIILLAARYHAMKDVPNFLRAMALLRDRGIVVTPRLVGEGCSWENKELRELVGAFGLESLVECGGLVSDMYAEYARAAVVVSSSAWGEGFQNVLAEAALCSVPVVSTDVGEARILVGDNRFVVPPQQPQLLADAIAFTLGLRPDERYAVCELRRRRVESEYGVAVMRRRYESLYVSLVGRQP